VESAWTSIYKESSIFCPPVCQYLLPVIVQYYDAPSLYIHSVNPFEIFVILLIVVGLRLIVLS
jgi:hypothetical protein